MTKNFTDFDLPEKLQKALADMGYTTPTPIQQQAIPHALEGRDILGSAQTGTGKTGAFGVPLVASLMASPRGKALILLPTRELAMQVVDVLQQLLKHQPAIRTSLLIGGAPMPQQIRELRMRPRLIVGTPGRINDHLERGTLLLHDVSFLVLDETDRMLDMGFGIQLDAMFRFLPAQRQTLMFSATLPKNIINLSKKYLTNPERVAAGETSSPAKNITQSVITLDQRDKYETLLNELGRREGSVIIFVKTKRGADNIAQKLERKGHKVAAIHGDLQQRKRTKVLQSFRDEEFRILVATDVAARGLDVPHIEHVINYDLPLVAEDYIHRIGRTARAGAKGESVCFVTPDDTDLWNNIAKLMDEEIEGAEDIPASSASSSRPGKPGNRGNKNGSRRRFHSKPKPNRDGNKRTEGNKPSGNQKSGEKKAGAGRPPRRRRPRSKPKE